ncbi:unnamed protein product, partial [Musa textilis]
GFWADAASDRSAALQPTVSYIFTWETHQKHGKTGCQGYVQTWASDEWNVER